MNENNEQYRGAPVHPLAVILVLVLDYAWTLVEGGATLTGVGLIAEPVLILVLAIVAFIGVLLTQKSVAHDTFGAATAKAFVLAVVAAVPFPVMSTAVGSILLAWAGLSTLKLHRTGG